MNEHKKVPIAGVLGTSVNNSLSPLIHGYWLNKYKIKGYYLPFQVEDENLELVLKTLPHIGCVGFNVTIPYKEKIIKYMDSISDIAKEIGSVNTVTYSKNNGYIGDNSDYIGFKNHFFSVFKSSDTKNIAVIVIGAGGSTRAIIMSLIQKIENVNIIIANRTIKNAEVLKEHFSKANIKCIELNEIEHYLPVASAIINTSSMGMYGKNDIDLNWKIANKNILVYDIVYLPKQTLFLKNASIEGLQVSNGLGMLINQAILGFSFWYNVEPSVDSSIFEYIYEKLSD